MRNLPHLILSVSGIRYEKRSSLASSHIVATNNASQVKISWPEKCFHRYVEFVLDCSEGNDNKWQCFDFSESRPPLYIHAGNFCSMSNVNHPPPAWNGFYFDNLWVYFANQQKNAPADCYRDWIEGNYNQLGIYQIQGTCYFDDAIGAESHGYDPDDDNTATMARAAEFMA